MFNISDNTPPYIMTWLAVTVWIGIKFISWVNPVAALVINHLALYEGFGETLFILIS